MNLYLKKYIKYKTKYFNLIGGMQDFEILNKCELFLDKIFFHAIASFNDYYYNQPEKQLIITGRKVNQLCNNNKIALSDDKEFLYTIYINENNIDIEDDINYLIRYFNRVLDDIIYNSSTILLMYDTLMKKLGFDTHDYPNYLFNRNDYIINYKINTDKQINICKIIPANFTNIQSIKYPMRKINRAYGRSLEYYNILLDITNRPSNIKNIIILTLIKKFVLDIIYFKYLIQINDKLLLTNKNIDCMPKVYDNDLNNFKHNYLQYTQKIEESYYFNTLCTSRTQGTPRLLNHIPDDLKLYVNNITLPERFDIDKFFIDIRDRYISNSSYINAEVFKILNLSVPSYNSYVDFQNKQLDIYIYIDVFLKLMDIVNNPIKSKIKFNVYSVSQSLYNFNDENFEFVKDQIYTFPIFKSTTLTTKYEHHPTFIGNDIIPLVLDIEINPEILTGTEFTFLNTDQYEIVLAPGSQIKITNIDICYTNFNDIYTDTKLIQACTHLKAELLPATDDIKILIREHIGGYPNQSNSKKKIQEINKFKEIQKNKLDKYFNIIKNKINKNPFTFYYHELEKKEDLIKN
jgi:hypothetical protein